MVVRSPRNRKWSLAGNARFQWVTRIPITAMACLIAITAHSFCGCEDPTTRTGGAAATGGAGQPSHADQPPDDGISAEQILRSALNRYATATSYSDRAVLYMSYRMHGRPIQEPQPWATSWDNQGRFGANLFNSQIRCDGQRFSCYVYDIDSGNLDNQRLLLPGQGRLPIENLYTDPIARHFVAGFSEMPLDETDATQPKLIPPPISLLVGARQRSEGLQNSWLQRPDRMQRMADAMVDERRCRVIRITDGRTTSDVWVDAENGTIWQMSLPLQLIDDKVTSSPDIEDLMLVARFHDAQFNQPLDPEFVTIKPRTNSTPVRKFVKLPESFPSELIGKTAPDFQLFKRNGKPIGKLDFDGKTTTLVWVAGTSSLESITKLNRMSNRFKGEGRELGIVFTDTEMVDPASGSMELQPQFAEAAKNSSVPFYYDQQLLASAALKIKTIPAAIVLDVDSQVQFARTLGDETWEQELIAAADRIATGEDVAREMTAEYERFLDTYHQQLIAVSASDIAHGLGAANAAANSTAIQSGTLNAVQSAVQNAGMRTGGNLRLKSTLQWSNTEFKQPGNITIVNDTNRKRIFVFDGWRTIVELNANGKTIKRTALDLPDAEAVNLLQATVDQQDKLWFAVHDSNGQAVFIYDANWKPVARYPASSVEHAGIRDCQFTTHRNESVLLVAFADKQGVQNVRLSDGSSEPFSDSRCESISARDQWAAVSDGSVGLFDASGKFNASQIDDWRFNRVSSSNSIFVTGMTASEDWHLIGMKNDLKFQWSVPMGSQFFDTQIQPMSVCKIGNQTVCAIADTSGHIAFVSETGKWLGEFRTSTKLRGLRLTVRGIQPHLIVATDKRVQGFDLQFVTNPVQPASSK